MHGLVEAEPRERGRPRPFAGRSPPATAGALRARDGTVRCRRRRPSLLLYRRQRAEPGVPARDSVSHVEETRFVGRRNVAKRLVGAGPGRTVYRDGSARFELADLTLTVTPPFGLDHEREYERVAPEPLLEALETDRVVGAPPRPARRLRGRRLRRRAPGRLEGRLAVRQGAAQEGRLVRQPLPPAARGAGAGARREGRRRGGAHPRAVAREARARGPRRRPRRRPPRARRARRPGVAGAARARALLHRPRPAAAACWRSCRTSSTPRASSRSPRAKSPRAGSGRRSPRGSRGARARPRCAGRSRRCSR